MSSRFAYALPPRTPNNPSAPSGKHPAGTAIGMQPVYGASLGVRLSAFLSPLGMPCLPPGMGQITGSQSQDEQDGSAAPCWHDPQ